jgi:hypothetical protein
MLVSLPPASALQVTLPQFIESDAQDSSHQLEFCQRLAIGPLAGVGSQWLMRLSCVGFQQRRREAILIEVPSRATVYDHGKDAIPTLQRVEYTYLFVDPSGFC